MDLNIVITCIFIIFIWVRWNGFNMCWIEQKQKMRSLRHVLRIGKKQKRKMQGTKAKWCDI